jgi:NAD(P)-dependent dehydrogenase (short-subunit alcohol dehydrogenase family)
VQKALPLFRDGGSIILNASIGASKGVGATSVYSATKAAIRSFARTWTVDLKHRKIRVNAISPGPIDTPIFDSLAQTEEEIKQIKANLVAAVHIGEWELLTRSPKLSHSWHQMTAAISQVLNCS